MLATYSSSGKLNVYRVQVKWDPQQWDPTQQKPGAPNHPFPTPSFQVFHIRTELPNDVFSPSKGNTGSLEGFEGPPGASFNLTHLDVISFSSDMPGGPRRPYVLAVFSSAFTSDSQTQQPGSPSILLRWQLDLMPQSLHSNFDDVVSKRTNTQIKVRVFYHILYYSSPHTTHPCMMSFLPPQPVLTLPYSKKRYFGG